MEPHNGGTWKRREELEISQPRQLSLAKGIMVEKAGLSGGKSEKGRNRR
jgi:hypothetical protein